MPASPSIKAKAFENIEACNDATYEDLLDRGFPLEIAGATYEWHCHTCGIRTWRSAAGGSLDCTCESTLGANPDPWAFDKERAANVYIWRMFAGQRTYLGTALSVTGHTPMPSEPEQS